MSIVYGIDLGTTYSCIARCDENKQILMRHPTNTLMGGFNLPSVIYYEKETGKPVVGLSAKNAMGDIGSVSRIMAFTKRYMGEDFYPEKIQVKDEKIGISPVEGSACILHHLLTCANEEAEGSGEAPTTKAVITIPAGFTNKQRECTKLAAELAGINVLGLVHEPTAAAISYGIKNEETVLVFDLGGGTLDVSLVTNKRGVYKVLATAGDFSVLGKYLGGKDWDDKLLELAIEKSGYTAGNIPNLPKETELWQLKNKIEECKVTLSTMPTVTVRFPDNTSVIISQGEFEKYTYSLIQDCKRVVRAVLEKADKESIDGTVKINRCVLSGGSSHMPMIRKNLSRYLADRIANGRREAEWLHLTNPHQAIAEGAALYAYMLENNREQNESILVGVEERSTHSYGTSFKIRSTGEMFVRNLILSTDPMIVSKDRDKSGKLFEFGVMEEGQANISVDLYENDSPEDDIPYTDNLKKIYDGRYIFNPKTIVTKNTKVHFRASRDKDGIISIHVEAQGHNPSDYSGILTVAPPISEDTKRHIQQSIKLMDIPIEECK